MRHRSRQIATHAITLPLSVPIHATPSRRTNYKTAHAPSVGACLRFFGCITVEIGESPLMIKASIDRKSIPTRQILSLIGFHTNRVKRGNICQCAGHNIRVNGLKRHCHAMINVCNVREGYRYLYLLSNYEKRII